MKGLDNLYSGREELFYLYPLVGTVCFLKHLLQVWLVFNRCALAAIHGVDQIKVLFSVQMAFYFQIVKLLLQAPVIATQKTRLKQKRSNDQHSKHFVVWNVYVREIKS